MEAPIPRDEPVTMATLLVLALVFMLFSCGLVGSGLTRWLYGLTKPHITVDD
jgi:hypothetical protein